MNCPRCQAPNPSDARFCEECGAPLELSCPQCGAPITPGKKFCRACGTALAPSSESRFASQRATAAKVDPVRGGPVPMAEERKQVTVLFADMKGSLEAIAGSDPEEVRTILDPVVEKMKEAVHRYEGTVNRVMGDGIMALFGAPMSQEDHAVRACYAALAMQASIARYREEMRRKHGVEVQIRVGVNSGETLVRTIEHDVSREYSAEGVATHLAARMEQLATPGSIRITAETLRLAEGYVQVKSLGPVPVKGLAEPIEVYELIGVGRARTRLQAAAARGLTRFVGRNAELLQMFASLERAKAGHGEVIALVGEPGVGKSRLVWEFTHSHRTRGWLVLESGSVSYGKATAYRPLIDLLRSYFHIEDRDDTRTMREKLTGKLLTLDRSLEPALAAFLALLDIPVEDAAWQALDPPQRRQRTLDACKRLVLRESRVQPLVLVFEDLHWIDTETQAFLDSVVDSLPAARLLLLVNYRPEYQQTWASKTYYTQLRVDPLPVESAEALLHALLGDDPALLALKQLLIERTGGNPLFVEESVRTLVETGVLVGERGVYRLASSLADIRVPTTVQAVLAARIDRLSSEDKHLLQTAAVIGKDVSYALLQAIADTPEAALRLGVAHLQVAEFLYETSLFPDLEYTFKHAFTHEVAYESLLHDRRRSTHARIVQAIETLYAGRLDEHVERLAHHALRAELWPSAVQYLRQAGVKAAARSANRAAVAWLEQALAALSHLPHERETIEQGIDIRFDLRNALLPLAELPLILDRLKEAHQLAAELGDDRRSSRLTSLMAYALLMNGDPQGAVESAHSALDIARGLGDPFLAVPARLYLGYGYYGLGDYRCAIDWLRHNLTALGEYPEGERFGISVAPSILSRYCLVLCLSELGEFSEAIAVAEETVRIADAVTQPYGLTQAHWAAGHLYLRKGEAGRATAMLERTHALCRDWNILFMTPISTAYLGAAYMLSGRIEEAVPLLEQALQDAAPKGLLASPWLKAGWLSEAYLLCGRRSEALCLARQTLSQAVESRKRGDQAWLLHLLGEIARRADPPEIETAQTRFGEALALAGELGMRPLQAHCHLGLGTLYWDAGYRDRGRDYLVEAARMYREMDMPFWLETAQRAIGAAP